MALALQFTGTTAAAYLVGWSIWFVLTTPPTEAHTKENTK
tara:strand:- start:471 stop:590 length:120 start_codon:yes stop_codon:yes gene_type:complete